MWHHHLRVYIVCACALLTSAMRSTRGKEWRVGIAADVAQPDTPGMRKIAEAWKSKALGKQAARVNRTFEKQQEFEWMWQLWTKPTSDKKVNPLLKVLGDGGPMTGIPVTSHSGLQDLMVTVYDGEPPPHMRLTLYKPEGGRIKTYCCQQAHCGDDAVTAQPLCGFNAQTGDYVLKPYLDACDPLKTIVIGNGGFGATGGVKFLAEKYNEFLAKQMADCRQKNKPDYQCQGFEPVNFVWRAGDSNHNMGAIDKVDLAITYEPVLEARMETNAAIQEVHPLFVNYFAIAIPISDPLKVMDFFFLTTAWIGKLDLASKDPGPVVLLAYIMFHGLLHGLSGRGRTYASRWNFSAMGLRDHMLMMQAAKLLATLLCLGRNKDRSNLTPWELYFLEQDIVKNSADLIVWLGSRGYDFNKKFCSDSFNAADPLYMLWHEQAVTRHRRSFPWDIRKFAVENDRYHMNDMAFLQQKDGFQKAPCLEVRKKRDALRTLFNMKKKRRITGCWYQMSDEHRRDYKENVLANPADLLLPTRSRRDGTVEKFYQWTKANSGKPDFWTGFPLFSSAVDTVLPKYADFSAVLESQKVHQKATETQHGKFAQANLFFWGNTNYEQVHDATIILSVKRKPQKRESQYWEDMDRGDSELWPLGDIFVQEPTGEVPLERWLRQKAGLDRLRGGVCADNDNFTDAQQGICAMWAAYDCNKADTNAMDWPEHLRRLKTVWAPYGYSPSEKAAILSNCPVACKLCDQVCDGLCDEHGAGSPVASIIQDPTRNLRQITFSDNSPTDQKGLSLARKAATKLMKDLTFVRGFGLDIKVRVQPFGARRDSVIVPVDYVLHMKCLCPVSDPDCIDPWKRVGPELP